MPEQMQTECLSPVKPTDQFSRSVAANVTYWRKQTKNQDDVAFQLLDRERQNLFRAAEFGLRLPETWRDTAELIFQTFTFVDRRGYWQEWIPVLEQLLANCPEGDLALRGRILDQLGVYYRETRQMDRALAAHLKEEQIGRILQDTRRLSFACMQLGELYWRLRRYQEAEDSARMALDGFNQSLPDSIPLANTQMIIGLVNHNLGQWAAAEKWLQKAVNLYRQLEAPALLARALINLGNAYEAGNKPQAASGCYDEAAALLRPTGDEVTKAQVEQLIGTLYYHQDRLSEAEAAFRRANSPYMRRWGPLYTQSITVMNLANVCLAQDRLDEAEAYWHECIQGLKQTDSHLMLANSLGGLAETMVAKGDTDRALPLFEEALAIIANYPDDAWGRRLEEIFIQARAEALEAA